jgi:hypothetical protein
MDTLAGCMPRYGLPEFLVTVVRQVRGHASMAYRAKLIVDIRMMQPSDRWNGGGPLPAGPVRSLRIPRESGQGFRRIDDVAKRLQLRPDQEGRWQAICWPLYIAVHFERAR